MLLGQASARYMFKTDRYDEFGPQTQAVAIFTLGHENTPGAGLPPPYPEKDRPAAEWRY